LVPQAESDTSEHAVNLGASVNTRSLLLVGALSTGLACTQNSHAKPGCEEACRVANMSNNDLKVKFGSKELPERYAFATPYVEGASYQEFKRCLNEAVQQKTTSEALGCSERSHTVCVSVCEGTPASDSTVIVKEKTRTSSAKPTCQCSAAKRCINTHELVKSQGKLINGSNAVACVKKYCPGSDGYYAVYSDQCR
jgi:hypothetical protein